MTLRRCLTALAVCLLVEGCYPPPVTYPTTKLVTHRRMELRDNLLRLLPEEQRDVRVAREEAAWLADTAYKAAAGISRVNASHFPGWAGNWLVNMRWQDRGLCWHYQHDMFRELRRRTLKYFRIGCCVRDQGARTEHNCVYIAAVRDPWPKAWVLDAWMWNGRLKVDYGPNLDQDDWNDLQEVTDQLVRIYPEEHCWPVEHWFYVRKPNGKYTLFNAPENITAPQTLRMYDNINLGRKSHPGKLTNY